jgi:hypothetical protein
MLHLAQGLVSAFGYFGVIGKERKIPTETLTFVYALAVVARYDVSLFKRFFNLKS